MKTELLQLGEMLQAVMQDASIESILDTVTETIKGEADATPDERRREHLHWYARQLARIRRGPQVRLAARDRLNGVAAVLRILEKLMLRVNRIRDLQRLPPSEQERAEKLGIALNAFWQMLKDSNVR